MASGERPGSTVRRGRRPRLSLRAMAVIPVLAAAACWLYVRSAERGLGPVPIGIKIFVWLDVLVVDDLTGEPIPGAEVDQPFFHPTWTDDDLRHRDLRREDGLGAVSGMRTDEGGRAGTVSIAGLERRLRSRGGMIPVVGDPEVVFHPVAGLRVRAPGHATWVRRLEDVRTEPGVPLAVGDPLAVEVRMKRDSP